MAPKHLEEGKRHKGGINREYQIQERPADPPPMQPPSAADNSKCFTDGKPRVATSEDTAVPWNGRKDNFRCRLCGHRFQVGDVWRWVFCNFAGSGSRYGNFFVCASCDGPDVLAKAAEQERIAEQCFWWFRR